MEFSSFLSSSRCISCDVVICCVLKFKQVRYKVKLFCFILTSPILCLFQCTNEQINFDLKSGWDYAWDHNTKLQQVTVSYHRNISTTSCIDFLFVCILLSRFIYLAFKHETSSVGNHHQVKGFLAVSFQNNFFFSCCCGGKQISLPTSLHGRYYLLRVGRTSPKIYL